MLGISAPGNITATRVVCETKGVDVVMGLVEVDGGCCGYRGCKGDSDENSGWVYLNGFVVEIMVGSVYFGFMTWQCLGTFNED